ncbi:MAG TPA: hypothetical protein VFJ82_27000 [Longimicrobium sp.]|nr:hypothetical protein [Longimicrobium sp.]
MAGELRLDSIVLRALADNAASWRAVGGLPGHMLTTFDRVEGWSTVFIPEEVSPEVTGVRTPVDTRTVSKRPAVDLIQIRAEGMSEPRSLSEYDAVFWSEAAVEKFVLPYYASKSQWLAAYVLDGLSRAFYGRVPVPGACEAGAGAGEDTAVPFAVAHLPRSDYAEEYGAIPLSDLHVLLVSGSGVEARPVSSYLRQPEPGA